MPKAYPKPAVAAVAVAAFGVTLLLPELAHAGALGIADSVGEVSAELVAVGTIATVFVPIIFGIAMIMGASALLATTIGLVTAGVMVGNADAIAGVLFNGGAGGGGSIFDTVAVIATSLPLPV
jgi:hypothetical protein